MAKKKMAKKATSKSTSKMAPAKKTAAKGAASKATSAKKAAAKPARAKSDSGGGLAMRSAAPSLTVADIEKSLAWYRDVLGFVVGERWEHGGTLQGAVIEAGPVSFMLGQDDWKLGRDRIKGQGVRIFCMTNQNVDQIAENIKSAGGTLSQEPKDDWGMRALSVEDPDGYKITIAADKKK